MPIIIGHSVFSNSTPSYIGSIHVTVPSRRLCHGYGRLLSVSSACLPTLSSCVTLSLSSLVSSSKLLQYQPPAIYHSVNSFYLRESEASFLHIVGSIIPLFLFYHNSYPFVHYSCQDERPPMYETCGHSSALSAIYSSPNCSGIQLKEL